MINIANIPVIPSTSNSIYSTPFAKLLEPGLRKIFFAYYNEHEEEFSKYFKVNTSSKAKETDWGMGAFTDWTNRADEFDVVAYQKLSPGQERTYTHKAFTSGFIVTREMYDDEQYGQMDKLARELARAGRAKLEKDAASVLKNAFSKDIGGTGASAIYDGVALCVDTHPLVDGGSNKGKNLATGALSAATLQTAIQKMRNTVDEANNLVVYTPDTLLVPRALEFTARTIVNSTNVVGSPNNDINMMHGIVKVVPLDYIGTVNGGSDTAWFLIDSKRCELNFFWRVKPEFKATEEFDNFTAKYRGYMRYSFGVSDWRGIVGSTGL